MKYIIILALLIILPCQQLNAEVSISSVTGTTTLTISGSGFGTHADESPNDANTIARLWDNFESGTCSTATGKWDYGVSHAGVVMNTANNRTGSTYCAEQVRGESKNSSLNHTGDATKTSIYMYCWRNFEAFNPSEATNFKNWRVYPSGGSNQYLQMVWDSSRSTLGFVTGITEGGPNSEGTIGADGIDAWHMYEIFIDASTGKWIFGKDGRYILDTTYSYFGSYNSYRIIFDQYCNGSSRTDKTYTDDTYISWTQARVMLSDHSTWDSTHSGQHQEIQIPTAWSDTSITVTLNQGSFTSGSTAYVYVVDSTGAVNATGYEITIGGSESPSTPTITGVMTGSIR